MSSAAKTLDLLSYFTDLQPEIGLSQLCRLANRDKATTYRHVQVLEEAGFIEQNPVTRGYRLGPALLQLAQTRERTVPRKAGTQDALRMLAEATGETVHVAVLSGFTLYALDQLESVKHSTRVLIDVNIFPLHATASGQCSVAFGPPEMMAEAVKNLTRFTSETVTTDEALTAVIDAARECGFAECSDAYERDVHSVSAPVFDQTGLFAGTVTVACVSTRVTPALQRIIRTHLVRASRAISHNWGGSVPDHVETAWARSLTGAEELESVR
ncbi:IclR family transcriptional regulator [Rhodophyticola sp. CCM32]|uniref:IclR family transcriptional regulator n=1 Tax=Rhodophyticola sp. CCM32 TaxID=2916397 RepID=UPI00107F493E|nr:IclR family transcriptional regulator [Rhodophyticola sp. CCM32]QBY01460.1 IclR family transcriptional regulator [Rhodophyticola sp. CCM32]